MYPQPGKPWFWQQDNKNQLIIHGIMAISILEMLLVDILESFNEISKGIFKKSWI